MSPLDRIKTFENELVEIRHTIHAHPEIGFEEVKTSALVAEKLAGWGIEVHRHVGGTGVVGVLRGTGGNARRIGLRADMDALPMQEETGLPFASTIPGKFHGCGHDGHTTMLLGAARYLAETRAFDGTINFIFQPAEEGLGGARAMLADDLFERFPCDEIYGLHNAPVGPRGRVGICTGPAMAGADFFDIEIIGKGSHGAMPSMGIDPIVTAASLVQALQTIVSRNVDPHHPAVLSVTQIHAGSAYNVIPGRAHLAGTVRAFDDGVLEQIRSRIATLAQSVAAAHGCEAKVDVRNIFTVLDNQPLQSAIAGDVATELFGADMVNRNETPKMGSEDFADMMRQVPGAYVWLAGNPSAPLHNSAFVFDDGILPLGAALLARIAERRASAGG